jgi:hypothetical protein
MFALNSALKQGKKLWRLSKCKKVAVAKLIMRRTQAFVFKVQKLKTLYVH